MKPDVLWNRKNFSLKVLIELCQLEQRNGVVGILKGWIGLIIICHRSIVRNIIGWLFGSKLEQWLAFVPTQETITCTMHTLVIGWCQVHLPCMYPSASFMFLQIGTKDSLHRARNVPRTSRLLIS